MTTTVALTRQPSCASGWLEYFQTNAGEPALPWGDSYRLTRAERRAVLGSIQQFQLGESGDGRRLLHQAEAFARSHRQPEYMDALRLFVSEEQRHSRMLGRFLDLHDCPHIARDRVQGAFRRIRGLAGFELRMRVLATAEVLAMPFYAALRDATVSPLLRGICVRILEEETEHLRFQSFTMGVLDSARTIRARNLVRRFHRLFLEGTTLVVWRQHITVFRAAGWDFKKVREDAAGWFERMTGGS